MTAVKPKAGHPWRAFNPGALARVVKPIYAEQQVCPRTGYMKTVKR